MKLKISEDKNFLVIVSCSSNELEQITFSLTKKVANWFIIKKKIKSGWDGEVKFIDRYHRISIGLWREVQKLAKKFKFPLEIEGTEHLYDKNYDDAKFNEWVNEYFLEADLFPYYYQIEGTSRILKYKRCTEEISTAGGKTLMVFMIFKYLFDKKLINKMLYVVPNINLVTQTEEKFYEYEDRCGKKPNWKSSCVFGGRKKNIENDNIVFGTFQSLTKKDLTYFKDFDAICIDEVHHAASSSIKDIIVKCHNTKYKFGLTGTLPNDDTVESFTIQAYLGPRVYLVSSAEVITAKHATPVQVIGIELDYLDIETKKKLYELRNVSGDEKDGVKLLNLEKDILRSNRKRLLYVTEKIASVTKNSLVLFADIKNEYGRKIFNWLKENTEKTVYYIDGGTDNENRDYYKKQMEEIENVIIVASIGTFGEGIDILNVHNIFIIESHKSEIIIAQVLGRGMRLMEGKEKITVIDFSDNYEYGTNPWQKKNYLLRHSEARKNIYKKRKFPYKRFKVQLS